MRWVAAKMVQRWEAAVNEERQEEQSAKRVLRLPDSSGVSVEGCHDWLLKIKISLALIGREQRDYLTD